MLAALFMMLFIMPPQKDVASRAAQQPFAAGQVWQYHTRTLDVGSTLTILQIDRDTLLGPIMHVAVSDVYLRGTDYGVMQIQHMPFSEASLRKSVIRVVKEKGPIPDFAEGYLTWKKAFNAKQAGVYTITVGEAVQVAADTLNQ